MRSVVPLFTLALLLLPLVAPASVGQGVTPQCAYYSTTDQPLPAGYAVRVQRYQCASDFGTVKVNHRADIVRFGESPDSRVLAQLEMHAIEQVFSNGKVTREFTVVLKDVSNYVRYAEVEYKDVAERGACSGATTFYYGAQTNAIAVFGVPCLPVSPLMP